MEEPLEMALCEQNHVILRPDVVYIFRVIPGCAECARLAAHYSPPTVEVKV